MADNGSANLLTLLQNSHLMRVLGIGVLVLLLQIPISMVRGVIGERERNRLEALADVRAKWGGEQKLEGPHLVVPYRRHWIQADESQGITRQRSSTAHAVFLAESLEWTARIDSETRYRGIFQVPVYRMALEARGRFQKPDFSEWGVAEEDVHWERAHLSLGVSDPRAIEAPSQVTWNGAAVAFEAGTGEGTGSGPGIHAPVGAGAWAESIEFHFPLALRGSVGAFFVPFGKETTVSVGSDWSDPSFGGAWLPAQREVGPDGFQATWTVPYLGRNYPQRWPRTSMHGESIEASRFGVELLAPVDHYRMALRSAKYGSLFLLLTFGTLWLFEVLAGVRIHAIQYLLVGAGICLFYLLELSLSEHLGFGAAYAVATSAVVTLIGGYCVAVLGGGRRAAAVAAFLTALYGYLFVLLRNQDYALLVGSLGLFAALAGVMYLTRAVDWYSLGQGLGAAVRRPGAPDGAGPAPQSSR